MIWAVAIIEAGFIAVCVYQIRELTSRVNNAADMTCRIIAENKPQYSFIIWEIEL